VASLSDQVVKLVQVGDVPALMDHMEAMRAESPVLSKVPVDRQRTGNILRTMISSGLMTGVIAEGGCLLVVLCDSFYDSRLQAYEQMFYVRPEYRGNRLAVSMVRIMEQVCTERGAETLSVGSSSGVADERTARLFEHLGYTRLGISLRKELNV
jgi:GNAT superfamily N-acetyltransferase